MRETITVTLPEGMKSAIDEVTRKEGISPAELVTQALEEYLFLRRFRLLRERMVQKAQGQGILTDEDVFDRVS